MARPAMFENDAGPRNVPGEDSPWRDWVSAGRTRNWCNADPLLDWLVEHGRSKGYVQDDERPGHDERTDFLKFIFGKGREFEAVAVAYIAERFQFVEIATSHHDARSTAAAERTWEAMAAGTEVIAQAVLWNPEKQAYGVPDLLVRSDILNRLVPGTLAPEEEQLPAADIPGANWHYRVVDIKFATLDLLADGAAGASHLPFMAQVWVYNEALGRIQGYRPPCGYLLGRGWKQRGERGTNALAKLARVDDDLLLRDGRTLERVVRDACDWIRRVRRSGATWQVLPTPSVPELRPNMNAKEDQPWHTAKSEIAQTLKELTLLPGVSRDHRDGALDAGLTGWDDPQCSPEALDVTGSKRIQILERSLEANHSAAGGATVFPVTLPAGRGSWREPGRIEFFVDFETVNALDDDFSQFPEKGGIPIIYMIGCGHFVDGDWSFNVFTADRLDEASELQVIEGWLEHVDRVCADNGVTREESTFFHWSPAEVTTLSNANNSAARRHGRDDWRRLPWLDLWKSPFKSTPIGVQGAFGYGLKAIAKSMHSAGLIETVWREGPVDGLGAMVAGWWCDHEARRQGCRMADLELMQQVEAYNEVDCRVMAEILTWLRANR